MCRPFVVFVEKLQEVGSFGQEVGGFGQESVRYLKFSANTNSAIFFGPTSRRMPSVTYFLGKSCFRSLHSQQQDFPRKYSTTGIRPEKINVRCIGIG
jgi:hypothetical protein